MTFFAAIRSGFGSVLRFRGRQARASFWYYVAAVIALAMLGGVAIILPTIADMFGQMQSFAALHPDQATVEQGPGSYSIQIHGRHPELMPNMAALAWEQSACIAIVVVLLAAAVARRLHDRGRSGWFGALPLPFLGIGLIGLPLLFGQFQSSAAPDFRLFGLLFLNNLLYLGTLIALIVMLAQPGELVANSHGEPPSL